MLAATASVAGSPVTPEPPETATPAPAYEEYAIASASIQRGKEEQTITRMAEQGWELVREEQAADGTRYVFRRQRAQVAPRG
jgi:hypothetical protein